MAEMKETDLAWTAGMFEGEGSVRITNPRSRYRQCVRCELSNTNKQIVNYFHERWGGSVNPVYGKEEDRKPQTRWVVQGENAWRFLHAIRLFLKTDHYTEKVSIGIAALICVEPEKQWEYYERMRILNAKGRKALVDGGQQHV